MSFVNNDLEFKKTGEKDVQEKLSEPILTNKSETTYQMESNIEELDDNPSESDDESDDGVDEQAKILENLKEASKHSFDEGSSHDDDDDDDDDDGESKVCVKCKEDFITYSGKDMCPQCR